MCHCDGLLPVAHAGTCASSRRHPTCARCDAGGLTLQNIEQLGMQCALATTQLAAPRLRSDKEFSQRQVGACVVTCPGPTVASFTRGGPRLWRCGRTWLDPA